MTIPLDRSTIAIHLLSTQLRSLFTPTPHPMLNTSTSRALPRPAGGKDAHSDFHDTASRTFKSTASWGIYNVLSWCTIVLSPDELEKKFGLILPPTLILMDDWEPPWRERGARVFDSWMMKVSAETMRMGVDQLLLNSLIHTLSLNSHPPLKDVMPVTLRMIGYAMRDKDRAERYAEVMEKGIIQAWTYALSGKEGKEVLIRIAGEVEMMCEVLGSGIVRWLKVRDSHYCIVYSSHMLSRSFLICSIRCNTSRPSQLFPITKSIYPPYSAS